MLASTEALFLPRGLGRGSSEHLPTASRRHIAGRATPECVATAARVKDLAERNLPPAQNGRKRQRASEGAQMHSREPIHPTRGGPTPSTPIAIGCRACSGSATARSLPFYPLDCSPVGRRRRRKTSTRRATRTSFRAWRRFCRRSMPRTPPAALFWRRSSPTRWRCASITICRSVSMLAPASCRRRSHLHS